MSLLTLLTEEKAIELLLTGLSLLGKARSLEVGNQDGNEVGYGVEVEVVRCEIDVRPSHGHEKMDEEQGPCRRAPSFVIVIVCCVDAG